MLNYIKLAFGHDHLGHELSDGKRGVISSLDVYVKDIFDHVSKAKVSKVRVDHAISAPTSFS